jgi:parvulin-like peptidyl-prolyl isomerase
MQKKLFGLLSLLLLTSSLLIGKTLVTVNGNKIDDSIIPKGYEKLDDTKRAKLMEHLIKEELIHADLLKSRITSNPKFLEAFAQQKELAQKEYKKASGKELTKEQIRNIKGSIALMAYQEKQFEATKVKESETKEFYNRNQEKFNFPNSIEIANIITKTKEEAQNIIKRLKASKNFDKDFAKIAKENKQRGYMGWFGEGMAPDAIFSEAYKAKPKTLISKPIQTKYGFHVIYLINKKAAKKLSYDESKVNIENILKRKKVIKALKEKIDALYAEADIVY